MKKKIAVFLITLFIMPSYALAYSSKLIPGGNTIGININSNGVMIVGFYKINGKYNKGEEKELKPGDYIKKINDIDINSTNDLLTTIDKYVEDKKVTVTFLRNKKEYKTNLLLININNTYKTGLYVKDSITGIGTLTYIDPETNIYGALGHEVIESNTKNKIEVKDGSIYRSYVTSIDRSINGTPGSKNAKFYENTKYGNVLSNTKYGIYGNYSSKFDTSNLVEIKKLNEINLGKAYIRTVTDGENIEEYEIEIVKINPDNKLKSISYIITDDKLLNKAGGIVQGMSGSPIFQDGKLIGAVTHVLVDDVKKGYGIGIITMLEEGDRYININ